MTQAGPSLTTLEVATSFSRPQRAGARPASRARNTAGTLPPSPTRPPTTSSRALAATILRRPLLAPGGPFGHGLMEHLGAMRSGIKGNQTMLAARKTLGQQLLEGEEMAQSVA